MSVFETKEKGALPFFHEEHHSEEDDDEEEDAGDDPGDLHRVISLFLRLHCVGFVSGGSWENIRMHKDQTKK